VAIDLINIGRTYFHNGKPVDKITTSGTATYVRNLNIGSSYKWTDSSSSGATSVDYIPVIETKTYSGFQELDNSNGASSVHIEPVFFNGNKEVVEKVFPEEQWINVSPGQIGQSHFEVVAPLGSKYLGVVPINTKYRFSKISQCKYNEIGDFVYAPEDILK